MIAAFIDALLGEDDVRGHAQRLATERLLRYRQEKVERFIRYHERWGALLHHARPSVGRVIRLTPTRASYYRERAQENQA
jgi:hypothetical protein